MTTPGSSRARRSSRSGSPSSASSGPEGERRLHPLGEVVGAGEAQQVRPVDVDDVQGDGHLDEPPRLGDDLVGQQLGGDRVEHAGDVEDDGVLAPERARLGQAPAVGLALLADVGERGDEAVGRGAAGAPQRLDADREPADGAVGEAVAAHAAVLRLAAEDRARERVGVARAARPVVVERGDLRGDDGLASGSPSRPSASAPWPLTASSRPAGSSTTSPWSSGPVRRSNSRSAAPPASSGPPAALQRRLGGVRDGQRRPVGRRSGIEAGQHRDAADEPEQVVGQVAQRRAAADRGQVAAVGEPVPGAGRHQRGDDVAELGERRADRGEHLAHGHAGLGQAPLGDGGADRLGAREVAVQVERLTPAVAARRRMSTAGPRASWPAAAARIASRLRSASARRPRSEGVIVMAVLGHVRRAMGSECASFGRESSAPRVSGARRGVRQERETGHNDRRPSGHVPPRRAACFTWRERRRQRCEHPAVPHHGGPTP
jgi:hypothetical protein